MKNTIHTFIAFLLFIFPQLSHTQGFEWANQVEIIDYDLVAAILPLGFDSAEDSEGNVYMTGVFVGTQKFGDSTLVSSGIGFPGQSLVTFTEDGFLAKYSPEGEFIEATQFESHLLGSARAIEIDAADNIYLLLHFLDSMSIAETTVIADEAMVVAKFNADLELLWHKKIEREGSQNFMSPGQLVLSNENVFVTGHSTVLVEYEGVALNEEHQAVH